MASLNVCCVVVVFVLLHQDSDRLAISDRLAHLTTYIDYYYYYYYRYYYLLTITTTASVLQLQHTERRHTWTLGELPHEQNEQSGQQTGLRKVGTS